MKTSFQYSHQLNPPFFTLLRLKLSSRFKTTPIERRTNQSSLSTVNFHLNKKSTLISLPSRFSIKYCPQNNFPILFFSFLAMAQLSKEKKKKEKKRRPPVGARCYQSFHLRRLALYRDRDPINQAGPKQTATKLDVTFARSRPTFFFLSLYFFFFTGKKINSPLAVDWVVWWTLWVSLLLFLFKQKRRGPAFKWTKRKRTSHTNWRPNRFVTESFPIARSCRLTMSNPISKNEVEDGGTQWRVHKSASYSLANYGQWNRERKTRMTCNGYCGHNTFCVKSWSITLKNGRKTKAKPNQTMPRCAGVLFKWLRSSSGDYSPHTHRPIRMQIVRPAFLFAYLLAAVAGGWFSLSLSLSFSIVLIRFDRKIREIDVQHERKHRVGPCPIDVRLDVGEKKTILGWEE